MSNILLTSIGGTMMPFLINFLKKDKKIGNLKIFGIDKKKVKKNTNVEKIFKVSPSNRKVFVKKILEICNSNSINLIIPFSDEEAEIFSKYKKIFFKQKIKVMVNDFKCIKLISNKFLTYQILKKNNIRVPKHFMSKNIESLKINVKKFMKENIDFVIKPIRSRGGRGILICTKEKQKINKTYANRIKFTIFKKLNLNHSIFKFGPVMVMEKLNPPGYDVDCFVKQTKTAIVYRKRVNPYGIPYKGNIFIKPKVKFNIKKIIKILKLRNLFDIDFFTDNKGKPVLLEVNPRPSGSISQCYKVKVPFLSFAISNYMGINYPKLNLKFNSKKIIY